MSLSNIIVIIIEILGTIYFWKLIKKNNYELNFKESLLYKISVLILVFFSTFNFETIQIFIDKSSIIFFIAYFLILLIVYYIIRTIKLKKYIPSKSIIKYILITVFYFIASFLILIMTQNITDYFSKLSTYDGIAITLLILSILHILFIILLSIINIITFIINIITKLIKKHSIDYKNKNYEINDFKYSNIITIILIAILFLGINYCNKYNYNKMIEKEKEIVNNYLYTKYPNRDFEITEIYETHVGGFFLSRGTKVIRNEIIDKQTNLTFTIDIKQEGLTIYTDKFKEMVEEKLKDLKQQELKEYLTNNYNLELKYKIINDKLSDVEFIIHKKYQKEDIDLFVTDMKNVFNYIEYNFYDLDYIRLNFEHGNPFYEGESEYSKYKGSINENEFTKELWIMVTDMYIFIDK